MSISMCVCVFQVIKLPIEQYYRLFLVNYKKMPFLIKLWVLSVSFNMLTAQAIKLKK